MKITVYQVIRNIGGQLEIETFTTNSQADDCAWEHVKNIYIEDGGTDGYEPDEFDTWCEEIGNDLFTAWEGLSGGGNDTLHVEAVQIEVPDPAPALLAALKRINQESQTVGGPSGETWRMVNAAIAAAETTAPTTPLRVIVEVSGGVAEVTTCPDGVDVEIIDHDNERDG